MVPGLFSFCVTIINHREKTTMRKLVTVRTVDAIRPIPGADAIECAIVEGWTVVIKKGEFAVGDRCVFFEIDSFLPLDDPRFTFLEKAAITWNEQRGVRLRTMKLRGQISQGLILPLSQFSEIDALALADPALRQRDWAQLLGIDSGSRWFRPACRARWRVHSLRSLPRPTRSASRTSRRFWRGTTDTRSRSRSNSTDRA